MLLPIIKLPAASLSPIAQVYLLFVPVEAVVLVMVDCSLVTLVLGQVGLFVQNLYRLQRVTSHLLDHSVHVVGQYLPDLRTNSPIC